MRYKSESERHRLPVGVFVAITQTCRSVTLVAALSLLVLVISGCGILQTVGIVDADEPPEPAPILSQVPYTVTAIIKTASNLNPNARGKASPVRIRLFLAEPDKNFLSASFETVFEFDDAVPPAPPAAEIILAPGSSHVLELNGVKSQNQLVIAAAFFDVYSTNWIARKVINTNNPGSAAVTISASSVELR